MLACLACSGEIRDAAALWCPYCGASLRDGDTTASHAATISTPLAPGGVFAPDLRLSQYGPLNDARFAPGQIFASRYRIVSLLGRGAMGEVYRAEDLKLGQPVALKLIAVRMARGDERLQQFIAEVRLAREIAHPTSAGYDIGEAEGGITYRWNMSTVRRSSRSCGGSADYRARRRSIWRGSSARVWRGS
jgi:hypothetical protein